jgi:Putative rRNA methylase
MNEEIGRHEVWPNNEAIPTTKQAAVEEDTGCHDTNTNHDESRIRKTTTNNNDNNNMKQLVQHALDQVAASVDSCPSNKDNHDHNDPAAVTLSYGSNPAITATALAHLLWSVVVRPGIDTIIDATAGNGHDSKQLAQLLLLQPQATASATPTGNNDDNRNTTGTATTTTTTSSGGKLICMDIQQQACDATRQALGTILTPDQMQQHVEIIHGSHAVLPIPVDYHHHHYSLGLVVYNLGYLPKRGNNENNKKICTQTESTLASLAQAAARIRVGGMISVLTYPGSNRPEQEAVELFLTQLSSSSSPSSSFTNKHKTTARQFRVYQHQPLARPDSPILYTATRIR